VVIVAMTVLACDNSSGDMCTDSSGCNSGSIPSRVYSEAL
jgi:hypothetical protein